MDCTGSVSENTHVLNCLFFKELGSEMIASVTLSKGKCTLKDNCLVSSKIVSDEAE